MLSYTFLTGSAHHFLLIPEGHMRLFHSTLFATAFLTATAPVAYADINVVTSI